jgi:hypothetical protein
MATKRIVLLFSCLIAFGLPAAAPAATTTSVVLENLRKATLARPLSSISSIHVAGTVDVLGLHGTAQEWDDLRGMRFAQAQEAGALSGSTGWDGRAAWSQDYAGLVTVDGGAEGRLQSINQAYLDNFGYLRPSAGGAIVVYAGRRTEGEKSYDVLAVTPPYGSEVDLWVDSQTHLIARETATIGLVSITTTLSDYRRVDGITYPFLNNTVTSTGNSSVTKLKSLETNSDVGGRMRVPAQSAHDFSIEGGSTTAPLQIVNNHVYLSVMLNGRGPYTFVLDSGGDYIVTPDVASALAAKSTGGLQLQGVGNASESAAFTHVAWIGVGSAVVRDQYVLVLPIATGFGMAEGLHIDGMLGYQFLARFVTTIDYADSKITLKMPAGAPAAPPNAATIPFYIDGTTPRIPVTVAGVATSAEVDTGSRAGLTLSAPFLAAHPTVAALAKTAPVVAGFGVGGASFARLGRVPTIAIGPFQIPNSVVDFTEQSKGAFADPYNPANAGGAIWRRFDVTLDYRHQAMYLAKNATFDSPANYDRSGVFLIDANGAFTVLSALAGSPAASAGLNKGDVIVSVNGAAVSSTTLAGLRAMLAGPAGTVVHLHVRSGNSERDVQLTLADYV